MATHEPKRSIERGSAHASERPQGMTKMSTQGPDSGHGVLAQTTAREVSLARGSVAWLETMEQQNGPQRQPRWPQKERGVGSKRMRALSSQDDDPLVSSAEDEREYQEAEDSFMAALPADVETRVQQGLAQTNMQVCFSMNCPQVRVSDNCEWQLQDFKPEIMVYCEENGVKFENLELDVADQHYLKGRPDVHDLALWQLLKRGFIRIQLCDVVVMIWVQPTYTGRQGSNLSLNEIEYHNKNYVTPSRLRSAVQDLGASDCLVVSHSTYQGTKQRWPPVTCLRRSSRSDSTLYSFRLFFPSAEEANIVYKFFLQRVDTHARRRDNPVDTIVLRQVGNIDWDSDNSQFIRLSKSERALRDSTRVNVTGVTSEVTTASMKTALEKYGFHPKCIDIKRGRGRSAVVTFETSTEAQDVVNTLGETGTALLSVGAITMRVFRAQRDVCWECRTPGHFRGNCPLRRSSGTGREDLEQNSIHIIDTSRSTTANRSAVRAVEALVGQLMDSKLASVQTELKNMTRQCQTTSQRCQALEAKLEAVEDTWESRMSRVVELTLNKLQVRPSLTMPSPAAHTRADEADTIGSPHQNPSATPEVFQQHFG